MAGCMAHARNGYISTSTLKSDIIIELLDPDYLQDAQNFGYSYTFKADIGLINICMDFQDLFA